MIEKIEIPRNGEYVDFAFDIQMAEKLNEIVEFLNGLSLESYSSYQYCSDNDQTIVLKSGDLTIDSTEISIPNLD